ncbi:RHS repeat domain-containing protein [Pseudomonas wadenswilerensis]
MNGSVHAHTPRLQALDGRGLPVREVDYHRAQAGQDAERQVILSRFDASARQRRQWDARQSGRLVPSQMHLDSLSGTPLLSESADAGWALTLPGDAGQSVERWDARGCHWLSGYDERLRPLVVSERMEGEPARVCERFIYGAAGSNRLGRLVRHDDNAGSRLFVAYSLIGPARAQVRQFLRELELPDWPESVSERDALLETGAGAVSTVSHGPVEDVLAQVDALGHRQRFTFDLAGQLATLTVALPGRAPQSLLNDARYDAFGRIEAQTLGNGVACVAGYDPADGRLRHLKAQRPGESVLLDLAYSYDRVGNVLRIEDLTQPPSHFANQRVDGVSTFTYDSLSRLIEARGREAAGALIGPGLPDLAPSPGDTSRLLNYHQRYAYDASGNLLSLEHTGQQGYTRRMAVAVDSNHALPWQDDVAPEDPRSGFDANGNLLELLPGQPLRWNALNQLHATRQVARESGVDDEEHYRYGADGLRVRKVVTRNVAGRMRQAEVRYLPGLEVRSRDGEALAVITAQVGLCAVRCLVWSSGQPGEIDAPQVRYSLADMMDSSALELDGEGRILSHEGYYPFGGTAWWAGRSAVEAGYKVRRHAGKERDATGLYDYGLRYYAPWLMRWISPDPAQDLDGLNRYAMVRNNPLTLRDRQGLAGDDKQEVLTAQEQRIRFVKEKFSHELRRDTFSSIYKGSRPWSRFTMMYGKKRWEVQKVNKFAKGNEFFASDVVMAQLELQFGSLKDVPRPEVIVHRTVLNEPTLQVMDGLENGSDDIASRFLGETPLGKFTQHVIDAMQWDVAAVTQHFDEDEEEPDIHVHVGPRKSEVEREAASQVATGPAGDAEQASAAPPLEVALSHLAVGGLRTSPPRSRLTWL